MTRCFVFDRLLGRRGNVPAHHDQITLDCIHASDAREKTPAFEPHSFEQSQARCVVPENASNQRADLQTRCARVSLSQERPPQSGAPELLMHINADFHRAAISLSSDERMK